jgi:hypothetical protein
MPGPYLLLDSLLCTSGLTTSPALAALGAHMIEGYRVLEQMMELDPAAWLADCCLDWS